MTVYEALVAAQHDACEKAETMSHYYSSDSKVADDLIDRAYLLGLAIDNIPADVANMEV